MVTTETVKMSMREIQKAARGAGLPFAQKSINPLLTSLQMLGFLEMEEENSTPRNTPKNSHGYFRYTFS